ncbi:MAG UNVERIFIED_CONTAM: hypothetical protein LVT10_03005 [Anaerolineae bacterium]
MIRDLDERTEAITRSACHARRGREEARSEIEQELRILNGRLQSLSRTTALEILTDNGLLPNYAFPERGVRFYGAIYNKHRKSDQEHKPIEVTRPAGVALRELAPANHFTHTAVCSTFSRLPSATRRIRSSSPGRFAGHVDTCAQGGTGPP